MFGYIYLVINNINNKKYIGKRENSTFDENYWGSGKLLQRALLKYGKENFSRKVIDWADSREQLCELEKEYIRKYDAVSSPDYYNIAPGGDGGATMLGKHQSDFQKSKISKVHKGKQIPQETRLKISGTLKYKYKNGLISSGKGRILSEEHRKHISDSKRGRTHKPLSEESRRKIGEKNSINSQGKIVINNGITCLHIYPDQLDYYTNIGYIRGKIISEDYVAPNKGKICINNGFKNKYILENDLDYYVSIGYEKGRVTKKRIVDKDNVSTQEDINALYDEYEGNPFE